MCVGFMYTKENYFTDTVGGAAVGIAAALSIAFILDRLALTDGRARSSLPLDR